MAASSSSSSSSSSSHLWIYHVFLSFRGEDTCKNFTDHLYFALEDAGIITFRDDNELRRGEDIPSELIQAIQKSRISIIVFSRNYAASRWCLDELVKIMECRRSSGQLVLPIFYDVDPSDVRHQKGSFEEAFIKHERYVLETNKEAKWKAALTEAASLPGWDLRNVADGHEAKFIKKIVQEILRELNTTYLFVATYPVGIDSRVLEMSLLLNLESGDACIVGIHGMGGIGKTTIAKAVYNRHFHSFVRKSFLANISEVSKQPNGLVQLQEQLLFDTLKNRKIKISSVDSGIHVIKERLRHRKVLLILDDVDQLNQLDAIVGDRDWFGSGSRIIITTRDEHLLKQLEVNKIYKAEEMNGIESLELFSWHAFKKSDPAEDYLEFSKNIVDYCGGLPLALEVLGSFLFGRSINEWKIAFEKLSKIPDHQIQKKLQLSFDALRDDSERNIFLDISCFFVGMDKDYIIQILSGCGFDAEIGLSVLTQRCLVTVSESNKLTMHDLLRDMGRQIVREECLRIPEKRSRLWLHEDVIKMLERNTGTEAIEGLGLTLPTVNDMKGDTKAFSKLQNLRLLQLNYVKLSGGYEHFSKKLRWLCWHGFQLQFIPKDLYRGNLVAIDMRYSNLRQVWRDSEFLEKLKFLNLSHSHFLTHTPDFSKLPKLEKLKLKDCKSLTEVHHSIGSLERLVLVNLKDCTKLKSLPEGFSRLKSLKTLVLSGCSKFDKLPEDLGDLESLSTLLAEDTPIREVPFTIERLRNLTNFSLWYCKKTPSKSLPARLWSLLSGRRNTNEVTRLPPALHSSRCLSILKLKDCNLSDDAIPKDLWGLSSLQVLDLGGSSFQSLSSDLTGLSKLETLHLSGCRKLTKIPDLPRSLTTLDLLECTSLERLPDLSNCYQFLLLMVCNCYNLNESQRLDLLTTYPAVVHMSEFKDISSTLQELTMKGVGGFFLHGNEIPDNFIQNEGPSVHFDVPQFDGDGLLGINVCCVYSSLRDDYVEDCRIKFVNYSKGIRRTIILAIPMVQGDNIWKGSLFNEYVNLGSEDEVKIEIDFHDHVTVKKTGLFLSFVQDMYTSDITGDEGVTEEETGHESKRALVIQEMNPDDEA